MITSRNWLPWEAAPTAGDILERVLNEDHLGEMGGLVAEDAMEDVHEDVQKHAKRVSRPYKTRSKARSGTRGSF